MGETAPEKYVGQRVLRRENPPLLKGQGKFIGGMGFVEQICRAADLECGEGGEGDIGAYAIGPEGLTKRGNKGRGSSGLLHAGG